MAPTPLTDAATLLARYQRLLTDRGIGWEPAGDGVVVFGDAAAGPTVGVLSAEDVQATDPDDDRPSASAPDEAMIWLHFVWQLPVAAPSPSRLPALYELLTLLAPELGMARLELDPDGPGYRVRTEQLWPAGAHLGDAALFAPLVQALEQVDTLGPLVTAVGAGADPALAFVRHVIDTAQAEGAGLIEADRPRLMALLERAAKRSPVDAVEREACAAAILELIGG
ncbi:MAG: hypothetical protein H6702_13050 [Myxococcales bacterium]|nr:hypothetical protein [Myxococcales bacterium]